MSRPLTSCSSSATVATSQVERANRSLRKYRLAGRRQLLEALGEVHGVAHEGVLEALLRTEQGRSRLACRQPEPEPERRQAFLNPALVDLRLSGVHGGGGGDRTVRVVRLGDRRPEDGHDRVPDELHHRAALSQDGPVHGGPVRVELAGQLARVGVLGNGRIGADIAHDDGDLHPLGLSDAPTLRAQLLRQSAGQQARERLALLLTVDDGLVEQAETRKRALVAGADALGKLQENGFHGGVDRLRGEAFGGGDGLDRLALGYERQ